MGKIIGRSSKPYARVQFRGVTLDQRTRSALIWAEKHYREPAPNKRAAWRLGQGSYNAGAVSGSVIERKTSSRRPSSMRNSTSFHFSRTANSCTRAARADAVEAS